MTDWRDKDDLELTSDDLGAMLDAGDAVEVVHAQVLPGCGSFVTPLRTFGGQTTQPISQPVFGPGAMRVGQQHVS